MNSKKVTAETISLMSKRSITSSRMRNIFVTITIVLASALLTAILMFASGQKQREKNALSHRQQVGYYELIRYRLNQVSSPKWMVLMSSLTM